MFLIEIVLVMRADSGDRFYQRREESDDYCMSKIPRPFHR